MVAFLRAFSLMCFSMRFSTMLIYGFSDLHIFANVMGSAKDRCVLKFVNFKTQ